MLKEAKQPSETEGVRLTDAAAEKLRGIMKEADEPEKMYLYIGVKGGGCAGLSYILDLRHEEHSVPNETDEVFASQDIPVVVDLKSYVVGNLGGTEIDYAETLMGGGFIFNNPNAKFKCGCNQSFSA